MDYVERIRRRLELVRPNDDEMLRYKHMTQEAVFELSGLHIPDELKGIISEDAALRLILYWYQHDVKLLLDMLDLEEGRGTQ